jgi:hypothetical protein
MAHKNKKAPIIGAFLLSANLGQEVYARAVR